jgi:hypothetical protein
MMNKKRFAGFALVLIGILLSLSRIALTGAVIGVSKTTLLNFTTSAITLVGILMILAAEGESGLEKRTRRIVQEIKETIRSGKIGSYNELEGYARRLGCRFEEGKEHILVYDATGTYQVTEIPRHGKHVKTGTYRSIIKDLGNYAESIAAA